MCAVTLNLKEEAWLPKDNFINMFFSDTFWYITLRNKSDFQWFLSMWIHPELNYCLLWENLLMSRLVLFGMEQLQYHMKLIRYSKKHFNMVFDIYCSFTVEEYGKCTSYIGISILCGQYYLFSNFKFKNTPTNKTQNKNNKNPLKLNIMCLALMFLKLIDC